MEHYSKWIPQMVKVLRGSMTLEALAIKADMSRSYLSDIERGRTIPTIETLDKIFTACGATLTLGVQEGYTPPDYLYIKRDDVQVLKDLIKRIGDDTHE